MQITITHVNRLLKEAVRRGVVKITIEPDNAGTFELELKERFKLRDAVVVPAPDDADFLRSELGNAAATYFDNNVRKGDRVGIGSGRTLFAMVSVLDDLARDIKIFPLAVVAQQNISVKGIDVNTAVNALWFKSRPVATASRFEIFYPGAAMVEIDKYIKSMLSKTVIREFVEELADLDLYFFSCSNLRKDSQLIEIAASCGVGFDDLRKSGIIGDFIFNTVDREGGHVANCIEKRRIGIDLDGLRNAARHAMKKVVLVAGGNEKVSVIRSGLRSGLFNVLITDAQTAKGLLAAE